MNHLYRSLWNDVTRTFVAVAEAARGRGKRSSGGAATATAQPPARLRMMALEPRLMFDAAAVEAAVEAVHTDSAAVADAGHGATLVDAAARLVQVAPAAVAVDAERKEIVFIENNVPDLAGLLAGMPAGREVVVLDSAQDGLAQMASYLQGRSGIDALHIVSHGAEAELGLGTLTLTSANLAEHAGDLATLRSALSEHADLLLYGCDVGAGSDGAAFVAALAQATKADVAASTNLTGATDQGGDWQLERASGAIEAGALQVAGYGHVLPSVAGTIAPTSGNNGLDVGAVFIDGDGGSTNITGIDYNFFFTDGANNPVNTVAVFNSTVNVITYTGLVDSAGDSSADVAVFKSSAGENFKLTSFFIQDADQLDGTWTATAYENGSPVGTPQSFTITQSGEYARTVTLTSDFQNIDEVRISRAGGGGSSGGHLWAALFSNFVVADPVLPNTAPVIGNVSGDSVAWAGVGSTVVLDAGTSASLSDAELGALNSGNGNWSGASLSLQRSGTAVSGDTFGFNTSGALFTVSGSNLQSGGQTFATFTNTSGVLTINFTSSGTAATTVLVNDLAHRITYRSDTPAGDATVRFTLNDGTVATTADTTVTSDTIYVTNTTDTATINAADGVSISEAVAIAAADATGSQTLVLSSSFNSAVSLAGSLSINESLTLNADSASGLSINGGVTVTLGSGTTLGFTNASGTVGIAATLGGSGSLSKAGAGTLTLSSVSNEANMSGGITVTGGTLQVSNDNHLSSGTLTLDGGTLANVAGSGSFTIDNAIALGASGGTFGIAGGGGVTQTTLSGVISGSGGLTKTTAAILELSGNNTYTGATTISAGTLIVSNANALGTTAGATTVASGATARIAGGLTVAESFTISGTGKTVSSVDYGALHLISGSSTLSGGVTLSGDANVSAGTSATLTLSGALGGGAFNLNKTDSGTLVLSNAGNSSGLTGGMTISAGTLSVASDSALSAGTLTLGGGTFAVTGATNIDNAVSLASASTVNAGANVTLSGNIGGTGALAKTGAGTLTLSGTNTFSGATTVSAGGLTVAGGSSLGDTAAVTLSSGTTLTVSLGSETIGSLAGSGNVVLGYGLTLGGDNTSTAFSGAISSSGSNGITKTGSGTFTLSGANTYTGSTAVSAGTLAVTGSGTVGNGSALTVASGATLSSSVVSLTLGSLAGAGTVSFGANTVSAGSSNTSTTFSGNFSGSGTVYKYGTGTLTLAGNSSASSAALEVRDGGTLAISSDSNLTTGTVTLNGGTLTLTGATTVDNAITMGVNDGTVQANAAATLSGNIGGSGSFTKTGSATLTLAGSNSYAGTTTVSAGTLAIASDGNLGSDTLTLAAGSTLQVTGDTNIDNAITLGGSATFLIDAEVTASGAIGGSGSLVKAGSGTLALSSSGSSYSGGTTLTDGTLSAQNSAALGSGTITLGGGILQVDSASPLVFANDMALAANSWLLLTEGTTATFNGAITGSLALFVNGVAGGASEVATFGNAGNEAGWSGELQVMDATVKVADDDRLGAGAVQLDDGGTLQVDSAGVVDNELVIAGAASIFASAGALVLSGEVSGAGALSTGGAGGASVTLAGSNSHSGSIAVSSGKLIVSGGAAIGDASAVTVGNGATLELSANETIGSLAGIAGSTVTLGTNTLTTGGDNSSTTYAGTFTGTGGLTKTGSGTLSLSGSNTNSGALQVAAGGLTVSGGSAIANGATVTVDSGATLTLSSNEAIGALVGAGAVQLGSSTLTVGGTNLSSTFSGALNGTGNLTKNGTGTLTLSGSNGYTGTTTVLNGGTLSITNASSISSNTVTLSNSSVLQVTGSNVTLGNAFTLSSGGGKLSNANALTLSGVLSGSAPFTKQGTGVLTLSGANVYTGNTTVQAGTLMLTGSLTGTDTLSVSSGATLAGTGTVTATTAVVIGSGGTLSPGNGGAGTLTLNTNLVMNSASVLQADINGSTAGTGYDQVVVNGGVTLGSGVNLPLLSATHGYTPGLGDSYVLIANDGSDAVTGAFSALTEGGTVTAAGNGTLLTASFAGGTGNDFTLTAPSNSAPVVTGLGGDSAAYTAGSTVVLDAGGDAVVSDAESDSADWAGASLVVQRFTAGAADPSVHDVFGFDAGAAFTVSGNDLQSGGLTFATFTSSGGVLTVNFTGSGTAATTALVQDVMRHVNYRNDTPYGDATIRLSLSDGQLATDSDVTLRCATIVVDQANDDADGDAADGFSLREALERGAAQAGADTIRVVLADGSTITLVNGYVNAGDGDTLALGEANGLTITGEHLLLNGTTFTIDNGSGDSATLDTTLNGGALLQKTGAGLLTLGSTDNSNYHGGDLLVAGGTLAVAGDAALGQGSLTLDGGTLAVTGATTIDNTIVVGSSGGTLAAEADWTASGTVSGSGALAKTGGSTLTLTSTSAHSGSTAVTGGTLTVAGDANLGSGTLTLDGGTLVVSAAGTIDNTLVIGSNGGAIEHNNALALSGALGGSGLLIKQGGGELTLSNGANATGFSGQTMVRGGTLAVAGDAQLGAGTVMLNGGSLSVSGSGSIDNAIELLQSASVTIAGDTAFSGALGGSGNLTKLGIGTLTLSNGGNATTFTGATQVRGGTLAVATDANLGAGTITLNGGTLSVTGATTIDNALVLGSSGGTLRDADAVTLSGALSGSGRLTKLGAGTLTLSNSGNATAFNGQTVVREGTLSVAGDAQLGSGALTLNGGTLTLTAATTVDNAVALVADGGTVIAQAGATLSGVISGDGSFTTGGSATLTASGQNTYTGSTIVGAGTLQITGALAGTTSLTVASGATLAGTGSIGTTASNGAVTVQSGGTLAPGVGTGATGTLTLRNGLVMASGATYAVDIAGSGHDQIVVEGSVQLGGASLAVDLGSYAPTAGDAYTLLANDGGDAVAATFNGLAEGATLAAAGRDLALGYASGDGNDIVLTALNAAPTVAAGLVAQGATEDSVFGFTVPSGTFADIDAGDTFTYAATLVGGGALPSWLSFDATTHTFSGTPANGDVGAISVRVTATDGSSAGVSSDFTLTVGNTNDAPTTAGIVGQAATEDNSFSFTVPSNTFADVDAGDTLTCVATLSNGNALPSWLSFDATTRTFSGTPVNGDVGSLTVRVTATDGSSASVSSNFALTVVNTNDAPTTAGIAAQTATEGSGFNFTVPSNTFSDADVGDTLTYVATLSNGNALPSWLSFDATSRTFNGTPANGDVGSITVRVTATDGSSASVSSDFALTVGNTNDAPTTVGIAGQAATEGSGFNFTVPSNTFSDADVGDTLTYVATLSNGNALPSWLSFDATSRTFNGTPANGDVGAISVRVTATDGGSASVSSDFALTVGNTNDAPTTVGIAVQTATEDSGFSFTVPSNTFSDVDAGDTLTYAATLANGSALPSWLSFDASTGTFSGTPANGDVGSISVRVTATDGSHANVSSDFALTVVNTNDAPTTAGIAAQTATEDSTFSFTVPSNTFADIDAGDALTYTATLSNGSALPGWLSFDATTRTFSGTPANGDVSSITVRVTATDGSSASTSSDFALTVVNTNDAPTTIGIGAQTAHEDSSFGFTLPAGTFADADAGDTLTYSATLGGGAALPDWLHFDAGTHSFSGTPANGDVGSITVHVTATDGSHASISSDFTLTVLNTGDAPVLTTPDAIALTDTAASDSFAPVNGQLSAHDDDSETLQFGIDGGTSGVFSVDGQSYDVQKAGSYGTLWLDSASGRYVYTADAAAANRASAAVQDVFVLSASDGATAAHANLVVDLAGVDDLPQGSVVLAGTPQVGQVLTAAVSAGDAEGIDSVDVRWQVQDAAGQWADIAGAHGTTLTLDNTLSQHAVRAVARVTDAAGAVVDMASAASAAVDALPVPVAPPVATPVLAAPVPPAVVEASPVVASDTAFFTGAPAGVALEGLLQPSRTGADDSGARTVVLAPASRDSGGSTVTGASALQVVPQLEGVSTSRGTELSVTLPQSSYLLSAPDGRMAVEARLADGQPLPAWLRFDPATGKLTGRVPASLHGVIQVVLTVRDNHGQAATTRLEIRVDAGGAAEPADAPAKEGGQVAPVQQGLAPTQRQATERQAARPGLSEQLRQVGKQRGTVADRLAATSRGTRPAAQG